MIRNPPSNTLHPRSLAGARTIPVRSDVDANVKQHGRLVHVMPAAWPSHRLTRACSLWPRRRPPVPSPSLSALPSGPDRGLYVGAFILSPGRAVGLYTKQQLGAFSASASGDGAVPPPEANVLRPGNRPGPLVRFGGLASGGRSAIWSERGELLAELDAIGAGVAVATESQAGWRPETMLLGRA